VIKDINTQGGDFKSNRNSRKGHRRSNAHAFCGGGESKDVVAVPEFPYLLSYIGRQVILSFQKEKSHED
jgi:hypothetical protein